MENILTVTPDLVKQITDEYGIGESACNEKLNEAKLLYFTKQVGYCLQWLESKKPTKTVSKSYSYGSYELKHMVEYWFEKVKKAHVYVSTSAITVAAIIMHYPIKFDWNNPNSYIGLSKKTIKRHKSGVYF